jgi:hypothetical protein
MLHRNNFVEHAFLNASQNPFLSISVFLIVRDALNLGFLSTRVWAFRSRPARERPGGERGTA